MAKRGHYHIMIFLTLEYKVPHIHFILHSYPPFLPFPHTKLPIDVIKMRTLS